MSNILEAYTHEIEHPAFSNFKAGSPARYNLNPAVEEEHAHLTALHLFPQNPGLTEALINHTSSSQALNLALVDNATGEYTQRRANRVSHAITDDLNPLDSEHHVYSGLGTFNPHSILEHSGGVFKAKHFVSATIDPNIAMRHDNHKRQLLMDDRTDSHILHFHLPVGYNKGRYIAPISEFQGEHEMLLDRDQHWKVDNVHTIHGYHPITNAPMSRTIWSVKPHTPEAAVKEEVEHRLHDYFDDTHPGLSTADWDTEQYQHHPNPKEFTAHAAHLRSLTLGKTAQLPLNDTVHGPFGGRLHRGISIYSKGSEAINDTLMGKDVQPYIQISHKKSNNETIHETIEHISKGISQLNHPLEHTLHVYSGTNHPHLLSGQIGIGDIIHTPPFTSTSIKHNIAKGFGWNNVDPLNPESTHHIIHFELPPGYMKGAYIQPHSWMEHEHEYLLDKDQKWKVKDHNIVKTRDPSKSSDHPNNVIGRHVWTVIPHEEKNVQEALVHVPQLFQERRFEADGKYFPDHYEHARTIRVAQKLAGEAHHDLLMKTHHFEPNRAERATLNSYTRGDSEDLNHHILATPEDRKTGESNIIQQYNTWHRSTRVPEAKTINDVPNEYNIHHQYKENAQALSGVINTHATPLDHEAHVYSGVGFDPTKHFEEGKGVIHMPAFTSTSLNYETPLSFGKTYNDTTKEKEKSIKPFLPTAFDKHYSGPPVVQSTHKSYIYSRDKHIIHFKLPVGYKRGLYVQPHSNYSNEHEYLLDKDQKWKLEKHETVNSWFSSRNNHFVFPSSPTGAHSEKKTSKSTIRRHIWTVVPHDSQPDTKATVAESMVHVPKLLVNKTIYNDATASGTHYTLQVKQNRTSREFGDVHEKHLLQTHSFTPSDADKHILHDFSRFGAQRVNTHLLQKPPEPHDGAPLYSGHVNDKFAHHVTNIINTHAVPLDHEAHVYSGIGFDPTKHFEEGKGVIHMPAFTSTSLNYETPRSFGANFNTVHDHKQEVFETPNSKKHVTKTINTTTRDAHIIHFKLPVGYKNGLYIAPHSRYGEEHEYLLDRGQKWKLEKHEQVTGWYSSRSVEQAYQNLSHSGNAPEVHYNDKIKTKTHIWTVVPHTEQDVHEALVHVPDLLKDGDINVHHSWHTSDIHKNMLNRVADKLQQRRQLAQDIGDVHDKHLRAFNPYSLSIDEREAVSKYTSTWSSTINKKLIDPTKDVSHYEPDDVTRYTNQLHHVIKKYAKPLDKESHFYSGIGFDPTKHFEEGYNVIHMPAFISSSASTDTAKDFGKTKVPAPRVTDKSISPKNSYSEPGQHTTKITQKQTIVDRHVLHFKCPVGFKDGLYVAPHSRITEEHEFLMNKGLKWKLEKHEVVHGTTSSRFEGAEMDPNSHDIFKTLPVKISSKTKTARHIWTVVPHPDTP